MCCCTASLAAPYDALFSLHITCAVASCCCCMCCCLCVCCHVCSCPVQLLLIFLLCLVLLLQMLLQLLLPMHVLQHLVASCDLQASNSGGLDSTGLCSGSNPQGCMSSCCALVFLLLISSPVTMLVIDKPQTCLQIDCKCMRCILLCSQCESSDAISLQAL